MPNKIQLNLRNIVKDQDRWFKLGELSALLWKGYKKDHIERHGSDNFWTDLRDLLVQLYGVPLSKDPEYEEVNDILRYLEIPYRLDDVPFGDIKMVAVVDEDEEPKPLSLTFFMDELPVETYVTTFDDVMSKAFDGSVVLSDSSVRLDPVMECLKFLIRKDPKWSCREIQYHYDVVNAFMLEHGFPYRIRPIEHGYVFGTAYNDTNMVFHLGMLAASLGDAAIRESRMTQAEFEWFYDNVSGMIFVLTGEMNPGIINHNPDVLNAALTYFGLPYAVEIFQSTRTSDKTYELHCNNDKAKYMKLAQFQEFVKKFINEEGL